MVSPAPILLRGEAKGLLRQDRMGTEAKLNVPDPLVYWSLQTTDHLAGYSLSTTQVKPVWDTYTRPRRPTLRGPDAFPGSGRLVARLLSHVREQPGELCSRLVERCRLGLSGSGVGRCQGGVGAGQGRGLGRRRLVLPGEAVEWPARLLTVGARNR